ncbi:MAG: hypothetical protein HN348_09935 [Proteobacteria bacterium]|jgi:hypothetical protein|nr:hypothetical protein [Pseudomonadota bacterium]
MRGIGTIVVLVLGGCNSTPEAPYQQVGYRSTLEGPDSGERGNLVITEVLWSGSVDNDGNRDLSDVFLELRNEGSRPVSVTNWQLVQYGTIEVTWIIPEFDRKIDVGEHIFIAAKDSGCFPEPDIIIKEMSLPQDPFKIKLLDSDERLMESVGSTSMAPFAGGYDLVVSRSMERIELMFGGKGTQPHVWHHYTTTEVDVVNNDRIDPSCQTNTLASPGRPNSPDYSGAYATGSFE